MKRRIEIIQSRFRFVKSDFENFSSSLLLPSRSPPLEASSFARGGELYAGIFVCQEFFFEVADFSSEPEKTNPLRLVKSKGVRRIFDRFDPFEPADPLARVARLKGCSIDQPTQTRALRNMRIQPETSVQASGCHESCSARWLRSGCGIMIVKRPSVVVTEVRPPLEPFGFIG